MENWKKIKCLALDVDGVLTDGNIFLTTDYEWQRFFYIRDGMGLVLLKEKGYQLAIITSSKAFDIQARAKNLSVDFFYEGVKDKGAIFKEFLSASGLKAEEVAYVGDDVIDLPVFNLCGISAAPIDAHPKVKERAQLILSLPGGRGAVREICDLILEQGPL